MFDIDILAAPANWVRERAKYLPNIIAYLTRAKVVNYFRFKRDLENRKVVTSSFPPHAHFQASAYCNSNCRLCPVGLGISGSPKGFLRFDTFRRIIDQSQKYLISIEFSDWGEPFLNPDIFPMIRYAEDNRIVTHASTNLHLFQSKNDLMKLLNCGLSSLIVSLHGVSQQTYEAYQPSKSFEVVAEKLRTLISLKRIMKTKKPDITLAFAITRKNQHEIEKMRRFAKDLGVDIYMYTASLNLRFYGADSRAAVKLVEEWSQNRGFDYCDNARFDKEKISEVYEVVLKENHVNFDELDRLELTTRHYCTVPWQSMTVNWDGTVSLCASDFCKYRMGDASKESIIEIWNNRRYRDVRKFLLGGLSNHDLDFYCKYCMRY